MWPRFLNEMQGLRLFITCLASIATQNHPLALGSPDFPNGITEEEALSPQTPDYLKCDSCLAVAFQLSEGMMKAERSHTGGQNILIHVGDILEVFDSACDASSFNRYGISAEDREHLVGPAFGKVRPVTNGSRILFGGPIPTRLSNFCQSLLDVDDEVDELSIYSHWVRKGRSAHGLANYICLNVDHAQLAPCSDWVESARIIVQ